MKKNRITALLLGLFVASGLFYACDDSNDWDVDSSYDQMFRPVKFSTDYTEATSAKLMWNGIPGTVYYVMQYAEDSLEFKQCLNFVSNNLDTVRIAAVEYEMKGLESNTRYSVRLKSVSVEPGKKESEWAVMTFKTKSEQILETPSTEDISFNKVILRWPAGSTVTHIQIGDRKIMIDEAAKAAGEITVDGLEPEKEYSISLYNGEKLRGKLTVTTTPKVPEADHYINLTATDSIKSAMFDGMTGSVTVVLPAGAAYYNSNTVTIPDGLSVNFFGKAGDEKPVMGINLLAFPGSHEYISFTNIDITGQYKDETGADKKRDYFFNVDKEGNVGVMEFNDCYIHHYNNGAFRMKDPGSYTIHTFRLSGCTAYEASNGYAFLVAGYDGKVVENIEIENSTFYNLNRFIEHAKSANVSTRISECTFYNVIDAGRYLYDGNKQGPTEGMTVENCIFGKSKSETAKGIRTLSGVSVQVSGSYSTSDWVLGGNTIKDLTSYDGTSADLFADPDHGDFTIKDNSFAGKSTAGARKWRIGAE